MFDERGPATADDHFLSLLDAIGWCPDALVGLLASTDLSEEVFLRLFKLYADLLDTGIPAPPWTFPR